VTDSLELVKSLLKTRFSAGVATDWEGLERFLDHPRFPNRRAELREELSRAIREHLISPAELERLTSIDQDEQADVDRFLIDELWVPLFGPELP
jgi:hypothetical protein